MSHRIGVSIADHFGVSEEWFDKEGIFNANLDIDAPLFIDPFLLPESKHAEFSGCGFETYEEHFGKIHGLLRLSENVGDKAWKGALKQFQFSEAKGLSGTCLGYSKNSTKGNGFGKKLSARALVWAKQVVDLGVKDPEMFSSMSLFEDGIGPDRISDMVANITLPCIIQFNNRIYSEIEEEFGKKIPRQSFNLKSLVAELASNPYSNIPAPIILLPRDILKHLPIVDDALKLSDVALHNEQLRDRVNQHISEIFKIRTKKEKDFIRNRAMESSAAFQTLLDLLKIIEKEPYDTLKDPQGLLQWRSLAEKFSGVYKLEIKPDATKSRIAQIDEVCLQIIEQFRHLVENCRLSQSFYVDGAPRHERFAQLLFYAIAFSYCAANDLDISPEADAGAGPVDFKFSRGSDRVVVEIKLSTNGKVVEGYEKQLKAYMAAEKATIGHYVVINVGRMGTKWDRLRGIARKSKNFQRDRGLHLIDGTPRASASKL
ncbi:hypothetical protein UP09_11495 [Bradyrhizobium sp. LTSP885]|uniref:hypothetical protein n=1 Tax=Bradyrhizobium sp. LTSP885 TaxID=1619232 RepID=UPI0005CAF8E5|nr:hypothetical protein [Bradyrhizobium sp. LTSP885]KJC46656.1 hypothetical protein UP09_11495 [Bradyrhizobium sp. LTSP885]